MSEYQTQPIRGRWGTMQIEYRNYDIKSYACRICGFRDGYKKNVRDHISEDHSTREKMQGLAEELGIDDESRIDRFRKVMETMGEMDWADRLTEARKEKPPVEEQSEVMEPGLNSLTGP